jgi:hypothetical protein
MWIPKGSGAPHRRESMLRLLRTAVSHYKQPSDQRIVSEFRLAARQFIEHYE